MSVSQEEREAYYERKQRHGRWDAMWAGARADRPWAICPDVPVDEELEWMPAELRSQWEDTFGVRINRAMKELWDALPREVAEREVAAVRHWYRNMQGASLALAAEGMDWPELADMVRQATRVEP